MIKIGLISPLFVIVETSKIWKLIALCGLFAATASDFRAIVWSMWLHALDGYGYDINLKASNATSEVEYAFTSLSNSLASVSNSFDSVFNLP